MKSKRTLWYLLILIILSITISKLNAQSIKQDPNEINLIINDSAARYVLADLPRAFTEKDSIWKRFRGYQILTEWHKRNAVPVSDRIKAALELYKKDTTNVSRFIKTQYLDIMDSLGQSYNIYKIDISKHLLSYLPSKKGFNVNIYIIALGTCTGTTLNNDIMVDIWAGYGIKAGYILNGIIHEVYHVGFEQYKPDFDQLTNVTPTTNRMFFRKMFNEIQNEGMATWVAYNALKNGYATLEIKKSDNLLSNDYFMLESDSAVKKSISQINMLIERTKFIPLDSLNKEAWEVCAMQRASYVAGAFMAKTIEVKYGREKLVDLVLKDEREFFKEYNAIVPGDYQIKIIDY
jgi:hypothetical protein